MDRRTRVRSVGLDWRLETPVSAFQSPDQRGHRHCNAAARMLRTSESEIIGETPTLTSDLSAASSGSVARRPAVNYLFIALDCERPHDGWSRHALDGVTSVLIGRGAAGETQRSPDGTEFFLSIPDRRASRGHARLRLRGGVWTVEDLGAKNGTWVNGRRVDGSATLTRGAVLEVGHTFMMLRPSSAPLLADVFAARAAARQPGLATLLPELAHDFAELASVARSPGHVTILGETGSGKDVLANAYHQLTRRTGAFIAVNCGALPASLLEASLFGHKRGAYSGATSDNEGLIRAAHGGTLFLDEIGDLPLAAQAALLRVLETKELIPIGCSRPVQVDLRIVCATHRDIPSMVARGEFREDLWARLAGHVLRLPPLRERLEDLGLLLSAAIQKHAQLRADRVQLTPSAGRALMLRRWPLNIRELQNAVAHALAVCADHALTSEHFALPAVPSASPAAPSPAPTDPPTPQIIESPRTRVPGEIDDRAARALAVRARLEQLLREHNGNVSEVARVVGRARPLLHRWLRELGIDPAKYRHRMIGID